MAEQSNAAAPALTQSEIDRRVFDLYDEYCHGRIDRRAFLQRAAVVTAGFSCEPAVKTFTWNSFASSGASS